MRIERGEGVWPVFTPAREFFHKICAVRRTVSLFNYAIKAFVSEANEDRDEKGEPLLAPLNVSLC